MAFKAKELTVFVYGFAKSERGNIGPDELEFWRRVASAFVKLNDTQIGALLEAREIIEAKGNDKD